MLILDENDNKKVSYFDIEKGKVVSEMVNLVVLMVNNSLFFSKPIRPIPL